MMVWLQTGSQHMQFGQDRTGGGQLDREELLIHHPCPALSSQNPAAVRPRFLQRIGLQCARIEQ